MSKEFPSIEDTIKVVWNEGYGARIAEILKENLIDNTRISLNFSKGIHYVVYESEEFGDMYIARFGCTPMSGCHAMLLFHSSAVNDFLRGLGIGKLMHDFRLEAAKKAGFTYLQCTTNKHNDPQNSILQKHNWEIVKEFINIKTGNPILYWMKNIAPETIQK